MEKYIVGLFDDEEVLLKAVKQVRSSGLKIHDVRTPFAVHGLDAALGMKDSRLHTVGFIAGFCGVLCAFSFITWITVTNYPTNFGGKPFFSLPAWIPIMFEFTVLSAGVTMTIAFFIRCGLSLIKQPRIFDERTTDYLFGMIFHITPETSPEEIGQINSVLKKTGVVEIKEKDFSADKNNQGKDMSTTSILKIFIALALVTSIASCERNPQSTGRAYMPDMMYSQAYETYYATPPIGKDSSRVSARVPVKGTIPVGLLPADSLDKDWAAHESYLYRTYFPESDTGSYERAGRELKNPLPNNKETIALGQKVFNINCVPCHGTAGDGQGPIVKSGAYPPVPAYKDRLPTINEGKMFNSITYGKNLMGSYASQVTPRERWAVIYYIEQLAGLNTGAKSAPVQTASAETGKNKTK